MKRRIIQAFRSRWRGPELDRRLALGADPASDPELMLRAARLRRPRASRALAATIEGLQEELAGPSCPRCAAPRPLNRAEIRSSLTELEALAERLRADDCTLQTIATASWLIGDADSPLYQPSGAGALRRAASSCAE